MTEKLLMPFPMKVNSHLNYPFARYFQDFIRKTPGSISFLKENENESIQERSILKWQLNPLKFQWKRINSFR
jgi:hypothetical protein